MSKKKKKFLPQALLELGNDILWSSQGRWRETLRRSIEELVQHVPHLERRSFSLGATRTSLVFKNKCMQRAKHLKQETGFFDPKKAL